MSSIVKSFISLVLVSFGTCSLHVILAQESKIQDSTKVKGRSGYQTDLNSGIQSLMTFLMIQDDAEPSDFLRFPKLDSLSSPWFDWKKKLNEDLGLQLNISYSSTNQYGRTAPHKNEEFAGSGFLKFYSRWNLINKHKENKGVLVFGLDYRHKYSDIPPSELGFDLGYNGISALTFSDSKWILIDLNWQQTFNKGRTGIIIGRYDPNDYFDILGYVNPWTTFQNLSILLNPSIALPDLATGIGIGHQFNDQIQAKLSITDANGVGTEVKFFNDFSELYTTGELSWSPSREDRYFKNIHITAWHADSREKANIEESQGVAIGANWTFFEQFMPFVRAGWSDGNGSFYTQSYTAGFIYKPNLNKDLIGIGINWGETQDGIGQLSSELFYRFQFSQNFAVTPSVQYYKNPGLNTNLNNVFVVGLRGRVAL